MGMDLSVCHLYDLVSMSEILPAIIIIEYVIISICHITSFYLIILTF